MDPGAARLRRLSRMTRSVREAPQLILRTASSLRVAMTSMLSFGPGIGGRGEEVPLVLDLAAGSAVIAYISLIS